MQIQGFRFDGPHRKIGELRSRRGIYMILAADAMGADPQVIDCGEAEDVREAVRTHERVKLWRAASRGNTLFVAAKYEQDKGDRNKLRLIFEAVQHRSDPICQRQDFREQVEATQRSRAASKSRSSLWTSFCDKVDWLDEKLRTLFAA